MIEYDAAVAATQSALGLVSRPADSPEKALRLRDITAQNLPFAWLGSCIDAIAALAESDGFELDLLTRAGGLWQRALTPCEEFGTARIEFDLAPLRDDIEDPLDVLNMRIDRLNTVRNAAEMRDELDGRAEVSKAPAYPGASHRTESI